jgi:hypothetical protein
MQNVPIPMCFKGSRTYLHGTDLYNSLCSVVPQASGLDIAAPLRISIHRLVTHECDMLLSAPGEAIGKPDKVWAEFFFSSNKGQVSGWMHETGRPVQCRYEYAEEMIERKSTVDQAKSLISIAEDTGFSPIEVAVAITKKMHYTLIPTAAKWLFTKLELKRLLKAEDARSLHVRLEHNFNNRLTKSSVISDGAVIGHIYFSLLSS